MFAPTNSWFTSGEPETLSDYLAQDQYKVLEPDKKMMDEISGIAPRVSTTELRTLLGCFLFRDVL